MGQKWERDGAAPRCGNCRYWASTDEALLGPADFGAGQCRRRAPVRNVSEVETAARIATAVHDVGLRVLGAADRHLLEPVYDHAAKETLNQPVPVNERNYHPDDDDNYDGYSDLVPLQQSWPLTFDWAWCGEHEPFEGLS